jgi:hypothetical protein
MAQKWALHRRFDALDAAALGVALVAPMVMAVGGAWPGAAQRLMFALAYLWIALALRRRAHPVAAAPRFRGSPTDRR